MIKTLNLVGIKTLKLVEGVENTQAQAINYVWLSQQFSANGFNIERNEDKHTIVVKYPNKIVEVFATYGNNNNTLFYDIRLENTSKFPKIKQRTEQLIGNQLNSKAMMDIINSMIPSKVTLTEETIPSMSMNNANQFIEVMQQLKSKKIFDIKETLNDDSGICYDLSVKKLLTIDINNLIIYDYKSGKITNTFNDLQSLMTFIGGNLGINDLTSQLYTDQPQQQDDTQTNTQDDTQNQEQQEQQDDTQQQKSYEIKRTPALDNEYNELVNKLSKRDDNLKSWLNLLNEDWDPRNVGDWEQKYRSYSSEEDKMDFIKIFINKKMGIESDVIGDNMRGLKTWVDERGFDLKKNLGLRFINNWNKIKGNKEIPTLALDELIYLANKNVIASTKPDLIDNPESILYENIYDSTIGYDRLTQIVQMYNAIYNADLDPAVIEDLKENYSFITANDPKQIAKQVVWDGNKLRDYDIIKSIYQTLLGDNAQDFNQVSPKNNLKKLIRAVENKKLDQVNTYDKESSDILTRALNNSLQDSQFYKTLGNAINSILNEGKNG